MFRSPAKRRKLSPTSSIGADAQNVSRSNPTTPTRASYAAPTRSSLARSHPNILSKSPGRRSNQVESRGKTLRHELLGGKDRPNRAGEDHQTDVSLPHPPGRRERGNGTQMSATAGPTRSEEPPAAVARAFETHQGLNVRRSPLTARQPAGQSGLEQRRSTSFDDLPMFILPKLVESLPDSNSQRPRARHGDLDLPPTPVQLGLTTAPDKPRGLASSSSPRSSRSGSGNNRRRLRGGALMSSPLKPKVRVPAAPSVNQAEEAPESELSERNEEAATMLEDIRQKQSLRGSLQAQLRRLRADMNRLEAAANATDDPASTKFDAALLDLLTTTNPSCAVLSPAAASRPTNPSLPDPVSLGPNSLSYLTLFAPGSLQLSYTTSTRTSKRRLQTLHRLTLTAPPPWPAYILSAVFDIVIDAADARIESLQLLKPSPGTSTTFHQKSIYCWITERLNDPLHKLNLGSLIWALGRWWDESIQRARTLRHLDMQYNKVQALDTLTRPKKGGEISREEAHALMGYVNDYNILEFGIDRSSSAAPGGKRKRGVITRAKSGPRILLTYDITLDWTGETKSVIDVAVTGVPKKAQESAKGIFRTLLLRKGAVEAFHGVWSVLGGDDG